MIPSCVARVVAMALAWVSAASCGPTAEHGATATGDPLEEELPAECPAQEPYPVECQSAYRELCESKMTVEDCAGTPSLAGGLSLYCRWVTPTRFVLDEDACVASDAPARCVGVGTPGDVGCSPHYDPQADGSGAVLLVGDCYPMGWQECGTAHAPPECACVL